MPAYMLTTWDNPFEPDTQWDEWLRWDQDHQYHSNALLARFCRTSFELSEADNAAAIEDAIDRIVQMQPLTFKKVPIKGT